MEDPAQCSPRSDVQVDGWPGSDELHVIFDGMDDGLLIADIESRRFVRANAAAGRMLGYSEEELLRLAVDDIHPPATLPLVLGHFDAMARDEVTSRPDLPCLRKDGSVFYADVTARKLLFRGRRCLAGFFRDVSERRAHENALRESEATLRGLMNNIPDLVLVVDSGSTIRFANHDVPGATAKELLGTPGFEFLAPEHRETARRALAEAFQTRGVVTCDVRDRFDLWWTCRLVPLVEGGLVERVMVICTDVTRQRAAEESLKREQQFLRHMLDLLEREREWIALEIHDGLAQRLTGSQLLLESSEQLQAVAPAEAHEAFLEAMRLVRESIRHSRRLVSGLRPPVLDEFGVLAAIEHLIEENANRGGPEVEYVAPDELMRLAWPVESALYRIVEESFANIRRHSRSDRVRLEVSLEGDRVRVLIRDFGVGFDLKAVDPQRVGIRGIQQRARLLEGLAEIESAPSRGTTVRVELPLVPRIDPRPDAEPL